MGGEEEERGMGCNRCEFLEVSGVLRSVHFCGMTGEEIEDIDEPHRCPLENRDDDVRDYGYDGDGW